MKGQNNPAYRAMVEARAVKAVQVEARRRIQRHKLHDATIVRPAPEPEPDLKPIKKEIAKLRRERTMLLKQLALEETQRRANRRKEWKR